MADSFKVDWMDDGYVVLIPILGPHQEIYWRAVEDVTGILKFSTSEGAYKWGEAFHDANSI